MSVQLFPVDSIPVESSSAVLEVSDSKQAHRRFRVRSARSSCSCESSAKQKVQQHAEKSDEKWSRDKEGETRRRRLTGWPHVQQRSSSEVCRGLHGRLVRCCKPGCGSCAAKPLTEDAIHT
jgi:hypothetical protein